MERIKYDVETKSSSGIKIFDSKKYFSLIKFIDRSSLSFSYYY